VHTHFFFNAYPSTVVYHGVASKFDLHIAQVLGAPDYEQLGLMIAHQSLALGMGVSPMAYS
jgi:hypothetical protein